MIDIEIVSLTGEDKDVLRRHRPSLLFWKEWKLARRDERAGFGEAFEFDVGRVWNANPCEPPCCPPRVLIETTEGQYVLVGIADRLDRPLEELTRAHWTVVRTPRVHRIVRWNASGRQVPRAAQDLGFESEHSRGSLVRGSSLASECDIFNWEDFYDPDLKERLAVR